MIRDFAAAQCNADDVALARAVNIFRVSQGELCIPISISFTQVARAHIDAPGDEGVSVCTGTSRPPRTRQYNPPQCALYLRTVS